MQTIEPPPQELELAPVQPGEAPMKQLAPYDEFKAKIEALKKTAETITVTDISQTAEMKIARQTRLALKDIRVEITHRHKELKADILVAGRKIDEGKNALLEILEPLEARLKDQEDFIERETARIQAEKRTARTAELAHFLAGPCLVDLGTVTDEQYAGMLADAKDAHAARLARIQKEKEEAAAKAKAEAEERERINAENTRLKAEAEAREAQAKKEREEAAAKLRAEQERAAIERAAIEDKARQEAIAAQKAREKEQAAFEAEAKKQREEAAAAAAKAKKEREAIEAKAKAEREAAEAKAKAEREAREKLEAEIAAKKAAEAKAEADRLAALEAAELAPEKEKLIALAKSVRELNVPALTTEKGAAVMQEIAAKAEAFAGWIEKKAAAL